MSQESARNPEESARAALQQYGLGEITGLRLLNSREHLYRVTLPEGRELCLRMYTALPETVQASRSLAAKLRSREALWSEAEWLRSIGCETQLTVPEPVPTAGGELVGEIAGERGKRRYSLLLHWVAGDHRYYSPRQRRKAVLSTEDVYLIGAYAARLHLQAEAYSPPEGFLRPRWDWEHAFGEHVLLWDIGEEIFTVDEMELFRDVGARVRRDLDTLGYSRETFGLVHRDLSSGNVIFHGEEPRAIDFDHCGWSHYLYDLSLPLLIIEELREDYVTLQHALLEGYQSERHLSGGQLQYLESCIAMRLVDRVNWALWSLKRTPKKRVWKVSMLSGIVERLRKFQAYHESPKLPDSARLLWDRLRRGTGGNETPRWHSLGRGSVGTRPR